MDFEDLKGKTLASVDVHDDAIIFRVGPDEAYELYHVKRGKVKLARSPTTGRKSGNKRQTYLVPS